MARQTAMAFGSQLLRCGQAAAIIAMSFAMLLAGGCGHVGLPSPDPTEGQGTGGDGLSLVMDDFWSAPAETGSAQPEIAPAAGSYQDGLTVNPLYRSISQWFYEYYFRGGEGADMGWTGDRSNCHAGTTSEVLRDAVLGRVNYYRAMAGIPVVSRLVDDYNALAQSAALMMSVNFTLSHWPDETWACYSAAGYEGASHSLLYLSGNGCDAIDAYVEDRGEANHFVPHRRMVLYPNTKTMGTGDLPAVDQYLAANALWVLGAMSLERPETRDGFVAWPPPGYVPYQVVFPRWSFSQDQADFSSATVVMTSEGRPLRLRLLPPVDGFGENTIVWEPQVDSGDRPDYDRWFSIEVRDVGIGQRTVHYSYTVIVYDPDS